MKEIRINNVVEKNFEKDFENYFKGYKRDYETRAVENSI